MKNKLIQITLQLAIGMSAMLMIVEHLLFIIPYAIFWTMYDLNLLNNKTND